jgi:UDP-3-O-[3-hydroxymyristoyl] glucosamine N-acyltransferase
MLSLRVDELAKRLDGKLVGDGSVVIEGLASLAEAGPKDVSLYADPRYEKELAATKAGAVVVRNEVETLEIPQILLHDPFLALIDLVELFHPGEQPSGSVHPLSFVSSTARLSPSVTVLPFAHISDDATIEARTVIHPGVYVGQGAVIGEDTMLWPNVVVRERCRIGRRVIVHPGAVIGADGFGFARREGKFVKIRHVGTVTIEDDVEIGANATIDRGTLGTTRIRRGVKIDNLVHIAHNVEVGEDSALAAQVGISGSTTIGPRVLMGGQVGVVDHLEIGEEAVLIAQSGVIGDIPARSMVSGYPARSHREVLKSTAAMRGIDRLKKKIRDLEDRLGHLEGEPDRSTDR